MTLQEEDRIEKIARIINGDGNTRENTPKNLEFIVHDNSHIKRVQDSKDMGVCVEGHFEFSPDMLLYVTGKGVIDDEASRSESRLLNRDCYVFRDYTLSLKLETNREDYLNAIEKFRFGIFHNLRFVDGKLRIEWNKGCYDDGYSNMFSQIRLFKQAAVVEPFAHFNKGKEIEGHKKQLMGKISELGLENNDVRYDSYFVSSPDEKLINFEYHPVAESHYTNSYTGAGFMVFFYSDKANFPFSDKKSNYLWIVTIPNDVDKRLQAYYNKKFGTPNIDEELRETSEDLVDIKLPNYSYAAKYSVHYVLDNEEEFLNCFYRWQNALYTLKHENPKEIQGHQLLPDIPQAMSWTIQN